MLITIYGLLLGSFKGSNTSVDTNAMTPGLKKNFFITAWVDIVLRAQGGQFIHNGWYKPPEVIPSTGLWKLKCGAFDLCIAEDAETLEIYDKQHKDLREQYSKNSLAEELHSHWHQLEALTQEIREKLLEFSDGTNLHGYCDLCSANTGHDTR